MRFVADESLEAALVEFLRRQGHDVAFVAEMSPVLSDSDVVVLANREQRVLLTNDKDFGELAFRQCTARFGIVLLRFQSESPMLKTSRLVQLLATRAEMLATCFTVLSDQQVRLRRLPSVDA